MPNQNQQAFLQELKLDYRQILLTYFKPDASIKKNIEEFTKKSCYANVSTPKIIEIHMELIDEFSKQLKLEGRSDDILLDYRLTLIDVLAHLCEMYRCSMYKEF